MIADAIGAAGRPNDFAAVAVAAATGPDFGALLDAARTGPEAVATVAAPEGAVATARKGVADTITVGDGAGLARALATAGPGRRIVLEDGVYEAPAGGRFRLTADGRPGAPVVIEARHPLGAVLKDGLELAGGDQVASGLSFEGVGVRIAGDRSRLTGSRITGTPDGSIAVLIDRGADVRVDHNELAGIGGRGISVAPDPARPEALVRPMIDHNWLHDFAGRQGDNVHEPIQIGQCMNDTDVSVRATVASNLLERVSVDGEAISVKSSDNLIEGNTLLDSAAAIVNRHGERNTYAGNWVEGSRGIRIRDADNTVAGNVVRDSLPGYGLMVLAGDIGADGRAKGYPAAVGTVLVGNDVDRLVVGAGRRGWDRPAEDTRIVGWQGSRVVAQRERGTVMEPAGNDDARAADAVRLDPADVGPDAAPSRPVRTAHDALAAAGLADLLAGAFAFPGQEASRRYAASQALAGGC